MCDIGDLKRKLDFADPLEQCKALGALRIYLDGSLAKESDDKSLGKHSPQAAALRLLWDAVCRGETHVHTGAVQVATHLVDNGKLKKEFATHHLITLINFAKNKEAVLKGIETLCGDAESVINPPHPLLTISRQRICPTELTKILVNSFDQKKLTTLRCLFRLLIDQQADQLIDIGLLCCALQSAICNNDTNALDFVQSVILWSQQKTELVFRMLASGDVNCWPFALSEGYCSLLSLEILTKHKHDGSGAFILSRIVYTASMNDLPTLLQAVDESLSYSNPVQAAILFGPVLRVFSFLNDKETTVLLPDLPLLKGLVKKCLENIEKILNQKHTASEFTDCATVFQVYLQQIEMIIGSESQQNLLLYWKHAFESTLVTPDTVNALIAVCLLADCDKAMEIGLDLLCSCVEKDPTFSSYVLPVFLHQYTKSKTPSRKQMVLEAIPRLATHRLCTPNVIKFVLALSKQPKTKLPSIKLLSLLLKTQDKVFPKIAELLTPSLKSAELELDVEKLNVMKVICTNTGDEFGEELLPVLSSVINESSAPDQLVSLSVLSIAQLCTCGLIELPVTWKQLWPKLRSRTKVHAALCNLLAVAGIEIDEEEEDEVISEQFLSEVLSQLWSFAAAGDSDLQNAAFEALAQFDSDLFTLKQLPQVAKVGVKIPSNMISTPIDANRNPEDVLDYIPGHCWTQLLLTLRNDVQVAGFQHFLTSLIKQEVKSLGRSMYTVKRKPKGTPVVNGLIDLFREVCVRFMDGRDKNYTDSITAGILLSYGSVTLEVGQNNKLTFQRGRQNLELLGALLLQSRLDPADSNKCLCTIKGWKTFMARLYEQVLESRCAELEMNPSKSTSDRHKRLECSWLWARDQIVEKLKRSAAENQNAQTNAALALAMLALAVKQYMNESNASFVDSPAFVQPTQWFICVSETLVSLANTNYPVKAQLIPLANLNRPSPSLASFASIGASYLLPMCTNDTASFLGPITTEFTKHLLNRVSSSSDVFQSFCIPYALAIIASNLNTEHKNLKSSVFDKLCQLTVSSCTVGRVHGLGAYLEASDRSSAHNDAVKAVSSLLSALDKMRPQDTEYDIALQVTVDIVAAHKLTHFKAQLLALCQSSSACATPQMVTLCAAFGEGIESKLSECLNEIQHSSLPAPKQAQLFESLITAAQSQLLSASDVQQVIKYGRQMLLTDSGPFLTNAAALGLAKLQSSLINMQMSSTLPEDYSYLGEKSVLSACFHLLLDNDCSSSCAQTVLTAFVNDFGERVLPPVDWSPIYELKQHTELVVRLALQQRSEVLAAQLFTPDLIGSITEKTLETVCDQFDIVAALLPKSRIDNLFDALLKREAYEHLWNGLAMGCSSNASNAVRQTCSDCAFKWLCKVQINHYSDTLRGIAQCIGDVCLCIDQADVKRLLTSLDLDEPLKAVWLRAGLMRHGHWPLLDFAALYEALTDTNKDTCILTHALSGMDGKIDAKQKQEWLLNFVSYSRFDSNGDETALVSCLYVLAAALNAWCPMDLPPPLQRTQTGNAKCNDEQISSLILQRMPFCLERAYKLEEWKWFAAKLKEWLVQTFLAAHKGKIELETAPKAVLKRCVQVCSRMDTDFMVLADKERVWDCLFEG